MSALPPKADIAGRQVDVRFVPEADMIGSTHRRRRRDALLLATVEAWRIDDDGAVLLDVLLVDRVASVAWVERIIEIDASENCEHISLQERHQKLECK
jgi:hypothetical protein